MTLTIDNTTAIASQMTVVPFTDDMPKAPVSSEHYDNDYENTLSFKAVDGLTVDICTILDTPGELIICVSDEVGNQVAGIVLTPALLQDYLNGLSKTPTAASDNLQEQHMHIHIEGNKYLSIEPGNFEESAPDEGTFFFDGMSYEAFWSFDGDEGWTAVEKDAALIVALYSDKLVSK
jgi:hypothetical protein